MCRAGGIGIDALIAHGIDRSRQFDIGSVDLVRQIKRIEHGRGSGLHRRCRCRSGTDGLPVEIGDGLDGPLSPSAHDLQAVDYRASGTACGRSRRPDTRRPGPGVAACTQQARAGVVNRKLPVRIARSHHVLGSEAWLFPRPSARKSPVLAPSNSASCTIITIVARGRGCRLPG